MQFRLFKTSALSFYLYVRNWPKEAKYIDVYQFDHNKDYNSFLKRIELVQDKVFYEIEKTSNALTLNFFPYKLVVLSENEEVILEKKVPIINYKIPEWQKGILKVKQHEFYTIAKNVNGSRVILFKFLHNNEHCPECWDEDLRSSSNSKCPLCGGTGYINKYSEPVVVWGNFYQSTPATYQKSDIQGKNIYSPITAPGTARIVLFGDVPVDEDDLLFYVNDGTMYKVSSLNDAYFNLTTFSFSVIGLMLSSTSIEYRSVKKSLDSILKEINGFKQ